MGNMDSQSTLLEMQAVWDSLIQENDLNTRKDKEAHARKILASREHSPSSESG